MARYENKFMKRFICEKTGSDTFEMERGSVSYDLSEMKILHAGVDTIRQLYTCNLKNQIMLKIARIMDESTFEFIELGGIDWNVKKSGKSSGYQYILKNLDEGFVVLLKSFYSDQDERGAHLKIEVTPQLIYELGLHKLTIRLREIGSIFAETLEASGVAVHLAVDIKGAEFPENWEQKIVTKARRVLSANGISNFSYEASSCSLVYGETETVTYGRPNSVQSCIYEKSKEAVKSDKIDFWESVWSSKCDELGIPLYDNGKNSGEPDQVKRIEARIHHSVIKEFECGHFSATSKKDQDGNIIEVGELVSIREPKDLAGHLQGIWLFYLNSFCLRHSDVYIHPIWQKLSQDVQFSHLNEKFFYKRAKKPAGVCSRRSISMILGYLVKLCARKRFNPMHITSSVLLAFKKIGLESELSDYFGVLSFGYGDELFHSVEDYVHHKVREHIVNGVAA